MPLPALFHSLPQRICINPQFLPFLHESKLPSGFVAFLDFGHNLPQPPTNKIALPPQSPFHYQIPPSNNKITPPPTTSNKQLELKRLCLAKERVAAQVDQMRKMKVYKSYVRNKNRPEGCIAESYTMEKLIKFCGGYLKGMETIGSTHGRNEVWDDEVEEIMLDGKPLSASIPS